MQERTISCHEHEIPPFVEKELERLYENIHCSLAFWKEFRSLDKAGAYIVRSGGEPTVIFLFRRKKRKISVLNEMIRIDEQEIDGFARYMFARFNTVAIIEFRAIQATVSRLPFPCQKITATEDFSVALPATPDEYFNRLGKATRDYIKRYGRKIIRRFPSFTCRCHYGADIDEQEARSIIAMNKARVEGKKQKFALNEEEAVRMVRLAKSRGMLVVVEIDGRLRAGSLSFRVGANHFLFIIAHDPEFDEFRLGTICYYLTIRESIARGARVFHMGRGWYDYKTRLLGVREEFDKLVIYRSRVHMALHCTNVAGTACAGVVLQAKAWLLHPQRRNSLLSRCAVHLLFFLRSLKKR